MRFDSFAVIALLAALAQAGLLPVKLPIPTKLPVVAIPTNVAGAIAAATALPAAVAGAVPTKIAGAIPTNVVGAIAGAIPTKIAAAIPTNVVGGVAGALPTNVVGAIASAIPTALPIALPTNLPSLDKLQGLSEEALKKELAAGSAIAANFLNILGGSASGAVQANSNSAAAAAAAVIGGSLGPVSGSVSGSISGKVGKRENDEGEVEKRDSALATAIAIQLLKNLGFTFKGAVAVKST
ncbi:uncharacterized protein LODBEIA_P22000 [Lodderomyces beijingensis]|uniref:Uncharacterized protein n=1 Tax=Lodderomyces beijingensis TaxID=1775926 RepID=A0ABP0ZIK4_9ASCO